MKRALLVVLAATGLQLGCSSDTGRNPPPGTNASIGATGSTGGQGGSTGSHGASSGSAASSGSTGSHGGSSGSSASASGSSGSTAGSTSGSTSGASSGSSGSGSGSSGSSGSGACGPGQAQNGAGVCAGPCGSATPYNCTSGRCTDPTQGVCIDPSTCPPGQGVDKYGNCGGACNPAGGGFCGAGYCNGNTSTCVTQCPPDLGLAAGTNNCLPCQGGPAVAQADHTCNGVCTPDDASGQSGCLTGSCHAAIGPFSQNQCVPQCLSSEGVDSLNTCGGTCGYTNPCASGFCADQSGGGKSCVASCPAGSPPTVQGGVCGGSCTGPSSCQSGVCDASSATSDHSSGVCAASCPAGWALNSAGLCGGQCAGNSNPCAAGGFCNEPDPNGFNFCVSACPNGWGVDAYGYCGGQCGDGIGGDAPVCKSGCCSATNNGTCFTGTSDTACGNTGSLCRMCNPTDPNTPTTCTKARIGGWGCH